MKGFHASAWESATCSDPDHFGGQSPRKVTGCDALLIKHVRQIVLQSDFVMVVLAGSSRFSVGQTLFWSASLESYQCFIGIQPTSHNQGFLRYIIPHIFSINFRQSIKGCVRDSVEHFLEDGYGS